jgi:hypothetical protein
MRPAGTCIASGIVCLTVGFGLECLVSGARGERHGGHADADGAADLFRGEQLSAFHVFARPASEGNSQDHPQCPAVATGDPVREKVLHFAGEDIARHDQSALSADEVVISCRSPAPDPADLPDFRALGSVADTISAVQLRVFPDF